MPDQGPVPAVTDEVSSSGRITGCDDQHRETYTRLLDADNYGLPNNDTAWRLLGICLTAEPERARKTVKGHMAAVIGWVKSAIAISPPQNIRAANSAWPKTSNSYRPSAHPPSPANSYPSSNSIRLTTPRQYSFACNPICPCHSAA